MFDIHLLHDVILVLAALVTVTVAVSAVMLAAPSLSKPRHRPPGGTRRDLQPAPEPEPQPDAEVERERELVLL